MTFALVLAVFVGYAYLAPTTFRTSALLVVEPGTGGTNLELPPPLEATQRLKNALLEPKSIESVVKRLPSLGPAGSDLVARLRARFELETADSRTFRLSCVGPGAQELELLCNELSQLAIARAPSVLAPDPSGDQRARERVRQERADELVSFLAAHPELTAEPPAGTSARAQATLEANDAVLTALRSERAQIESRLSARPAPRATDNPYEDPDALDPEASLLRRRLNEIAGSMQTRRSALAAPQRANAPRPSATLKAEWQRLLKAVAESRSAAETARASAVPLVARLVSAAQRPSSPVEPNRGLLLVVGLLVALGTGILAAVTQNAIESRPGKRRDEAPEPSRPAGVSAPSPAADRLPKPESLTDAPISSDPGQADLALETTERAPLSAPAVAKQSQEPARESSDADHASAATKEPRSSASGSARLGEIVEVNAPTPAREQPEARSPAAEPAERGSMKLSLSRTTQMLGSPIQAVAPPASAGPLPLASLKRTTSSSSGGYSYVSTPPEASGSSHAISESGPAASRSPSGAGTTSSLPPASSSRASSIVTPGPVPAGWRADPALLPDRRRSLCNELYPHAVQQCFVMAISGVPGMSDETSRVAAELAIALAETGHPRVLLLEANFQRPALHRWMRVEMPLFAGFSEQLQTRVLEGTAGPWSVIECTPSLHVLAEGVMRTPELILSNQFEKAVRELREHYDFIVLSAPLVSEISACRAVQDVVDGAIVVYPKAGSPALAESSGLFSEKRFSTVLAAG